MDLRTAIENSKCRKGTAAGTTKRGAYWLACQPVKIREYGGRGIGNDGASRTHYLELRHFRDGTVSAVIHYDQWHQNGEMDTYTNVGIIGPGNDDAHLLDCATAEDVIVALKGIRIDSGYDQTEHAYSDYWETALTTALAAIGLSASAPSPDAE